MKTTKNGSEWLNLTAGARKVYVYQGDDILLEFEGGAATDAWILSARHIVDQTEIDRPLVVERPRLTADGETEFDGYEFHADNVGSVLFMNDEAGRTVRNTHTIRLAAS